ncbi:TonB-dependent receptor plug domain-containing protein [uncultured Dokdonia sp.]|uniref:TonB-dependent receptor plug domain-containing protein n=1 Tax=uncultured Dokdonia sp. TaxID=575653 RepID=UPI002604D539|nr:TonB-dependent receptor plug domain-containing protein [uncultured Dokdonia sp.]
MKNLYILILLFFCSMTVTGQFFEPIDRIEKTYLHTDRPFYFPGETIWFKGYITNAHQDITLLSQGIIVELVSPKGVVLKKSNLSIEDGYTYGEFLIDASWVGGTYTIKAYTQWSKNFGEEALFTKNITVQKIIQPRLQLKFDFEKEAYGPGSVVHAKLIIKDLENNALKSIPCTYTLAIDGRIVSKEITSTTQEGLLNLKTSLPEDLSTTDVIVQAQIPFEGNIESIARSVPITLDAIDLQFMPESGYALEGYKNTIAFKALNPYGKPADISGIIKNSKGEEITSFESFHNGMGSFELTPKSNETYTAFITKPFTSTIAYPIQKIQKEGTTLHLASLENNIATFTIHSTSIQELQLVASDVLQQCYETTVKVNSEETIIKVPVDSIARGITKFSLIASNDQIVSERLVFVNYDKALDITVRVDKEHYNLRDSVVVTVKTAVQDKPVAANLSIAVADNALLSFADDRQDTIESYFLVSSELQGSIYKPNFYFDAKEKKAKKALEYLLLTHGWRSYLQTMPPEITKATFAPEIPALRRVFITDSLNNPVKAKLLLTKRYSDDVWTLETNEEGVAQFQLNTNNPYGNYTLIAYTDDKTPLFIHDSAPISRTQESFAYSQNNNRYLDTKTRQILRNKNKNNINKKTAKKKFAVNANASTSLLASENALSEVVVTGYGIKREKKSVGYAVSEVNSDEIEFQSESNLARLLSRKVSGIDITSQSGASGSATNVVIRGYNSVSGSNQALFIVDGVPFDYSSIASSQVNGGRFLDLDPENIASVNVLKGLAAATLYGTAGRNGVIVITTKNKTHRYSIKKRWRKDYPDVTYAIKNLNTYRNKVYHNTSKRFYMPIYNNAVIPEQRDDFRNTIYWNPVVQTNNEGKATFKFYTSDAVTSFKITTEGVSHTSALGRSETDISTIKLLNLDVKIPPYLSTRDTVQIPITIRNKQDKAIQAKVNIELPSSITLLDFPSEDHITIPAKGFKVIYASIIPTAITTSSRIVITADTENYKDAISKEVVITSPFFPNEASVSSLESASYTLDLKDYIPSSETGKITIYTDITAQVFDGIEGLIRKPYGCFEQASATIYPNVLVMQYFKDMGISNPEAEKKAMQYIRKGYRKLKSYEVKSGGFDWFGEAPADDGLTAYGILEFTDMKKIYPDVDQKLIDRTTTWLLKHKDNKGGFHGNNGHSGFSKVSKNITNAYIIYALANAGLNYQISKEFNTSVEEALTSEDTYRMALMVNAAFAMGRKNESLQLIEKLKAVIKDTSFKELPIEQTITHSYGRDKITETVALITSALLKEEKPDKKLIFKCINYISKQRTYGRFGSTQATVLSLKALIAFAKTQKEATKNSDPLIYVSYNGTETSYKIDKNTTGKMEIPIARENMSQGKLAINIRYDDTKIVLPYSIDTYWESSTPQEKAKGSLELITEIVSQPIKVGDNIRMNVTVENTDSKPTGMVTSIIGIPSGATPQIWQLKELVEKKEIDFYEISENFLVIYWRTFNRFEKKKIAIDLKAEVAGSYTAPASAVYLYYGEEYKHWLKGTQIEIEK